MSNEPPGRDERSGDENRQAEPPPLLRSERQPAAEEVRGHRGQVVPQPVEDAARGRVAAEPVLRDERVEHDERRVGEREVVRRRRLERDSALAPHDCPEREREQHLLPGRDDVERQVADAEVPELGHHEVVQRQKRGERVQRPARQPFRQVIATSVRPRLTIRASGGKSCCRSPTPSRWFSFAHGFRTRS